jgi:hypothetical protein
VPSSIHQPSSCMRLWQHEQTEYSSRQRRILRQTRSGSRPTQFENFYLLSPAIARAPYRATRRLPGRKLTESLLAFPPQDAPLADPSRSQLPLIVGMSEILRRSIGPTVEVRHALTMISDVAPASANIGPAASASPLGPTPVSSSRPIIFAIWAMAVRCMFSASPFGRARLERNKAQLLLKSRLGDGRL